MIQMVPLAGYKVQEQYRMICTSNLNNKEWFGLIQKQYRRMPDICEQCKMIQSLQGMIQIDLMPSLQLDTSGWSRCWYVHHSSSERPGNNWEGVTSWFGGSIRKDWEGYIVWFGIKELLVGTSVGKYLPFTLGNPSLSLLVMSNAFFPPDCICNKYIGDNRMCCVHDYSPKVPQLLPNPKLH